MKVLVIIPCYNEEKNINKVVQSIPNEFDYVVVNDGSKDHSLQIIKENNINYIALDNNLGIGGAVQTGYKYAVEKGYDIALQFDGDGQHDSKFIKNIIDPIVKNRADMVIGSRFLDQNDNFKSSVMRRFGISCLSHLIYFLTHKTIKDVTSGFRAVNRKVMNEFSKNYPSEYAEPSTIMEMILKGYTVKEIPVIMHPRQGGKSSISPFKSVYYMLNVCILLFMKRFGK